MKVYGPYVRRDSRKIVVVCFDDGKKKTTSYARWLLEQKLGRELTSDETVDHIDEDCTNDEIENLQVLLRSQNARKSMLKKPEELIEVMCFLCGNKAVKKARNVRANLKRGSKGPFCGRRCAGIASHLK